MRHLILTLLTVLCLQANSLSAQTAEQLKMLESLPAAQRAALLEGMQSGSAATTSQPELEFPPLVMDRALASARDKSETARPRVTPDSTIVVQFSLPDNLDKRARAELIDSLHSRIQALIGSTVFEIGSEGVLNIDDFYQIPLAGLTPQEAATRIAAEPDFGEFEIKVTLLPLQAIGVQALQQFGYDLFDGAPTTFAPATDIPVPANYVIGPGDSVIVQLFGKTNRSYSLVVNRSGVVQLPEIGPVTVTGMGFNEMRDELTRRIQEQMIGVEVSVTLGQLRSIRVFVLGDAQSPGSYTVSGLSTITHALFVSGGITPQGSLRRVQLKRNGRTIQTLDLYRLLLQGDTRGDVRLQPGDAIFVPPLGRTVGVAGEVLRPAIYELRDERTIGEVIELAGGLLPSAYPKQASLHRVKSDLGRTVLDIDLSSEAGRSTTVRDGDLFEVAPVLQEMDSAVTLNGHVQRPGARQYTRGMHLSDLIPNGSVLRPRADLHYILIHRESGPERKVELLSADIGAIWAGTEPDRQLQGRDVVTVFRIDTSRVDVIAPMLDELRLQSRSGEPARQVRVGGRIVAAGDYPLEAGMRVSDLVRAGGGLQEAAYTLQAELTRYDVVGGETRRTDLMTVNLDSVLAGDSSADVLLRAHDHLIIKEIPQWQVQESIEVVGEVRFPGTYILQRGETMSSILERAGGLTDLAFPDGSVFVRDDLMAREQEQIENLAQRLEADIVAYSLQSLQTDNDSIQALSIGQSLLQQLRETRATGRLVIDIKDVVANPLESVHDVVLRGGDRLFIPQQTQEVTVLGEVQYATSHIYEPGLVRSDYIARSGGLTPKADRRRIYVVRANGAVLSGDSSRFFRRADEAGIRPGDTIVAPLDADRMSSLALWTNVSQVLYQLALAAASAKSVGVL